jgi:sugar phosphate isomerase/epimerase
MNPLGIFAKTFSRPMLAETLDAVVSHGLKIIHFNYSCMGLASMPHEIPEAMLQEIRHETATRGITIAGVSGTYNMIDPDPKKRQEGMKKLGVIINSCKAIGTSLVSLCTGTRDPQDMWKEHPDNMSQEAWNDCMEALREALYLAEKANVLLAVEPEFANVIDSPRKARVMLDAIGSKHLKIILDPANIFRPQDAPNMSEILEEAFKLLKDEIVMAHAKDFILKDGKIHPVAAGKGILNYEHFLHLLRNVKVPLIMHALAEEDVDGAIEYINSKSQVKK